nr:PAS domain S-box protein [uncultured Methanoregula sp.]
MYSILYVDDDEVLLKLNKLYLEKNGEFTVDIVPSAQMALEKIQIISYDAVLSDYQMPGMDGIELLKEVRARFGCIPFLLFTGKGREEIVIEALNNGADFYIQKGPDLKGMIAELKHKLSISIERRRTEDALQKSRQQLTDIINFLPDATFVIDVQGSVIAWNHAIEKMTGIMRADILGKGDYEYAIPFFGERKPVLIDAVMRGPYLGEMPHSNLRNEDNKITSDLFSPHIYGGRGAHLLVSAGPLYDPEGNIVGAIQTIRDITDVHNIKRDLGITREKNLGLTNILPIAVIELNLSCKVTFANHHAYELFGVTKNGSTLEISVLDYIAPQERDRLITDIKNALDGRKSTGSEYILVKNDGSTFPAMIYGERIVDPETNEPVGLRGIIIDLTLRKKEALALRKCQGRLRLALEAGHIGIWDVDIQNMQVHDISRWINGMLGYDLDHDVLSIENVIPFIHPLDMPGIILAFRDYSNGKVPLFECGFRVKRHDGIWIQVVVRGQMIEQDSNGQPLWITGIVHALNAASGALTDPDENSPLPAIPAKQYNNP